MVVLLVLDGALCFVPPLMPHGGRGLQADALLGHLQQQEGPVWNQEELYIEMQLYSKLQN